MAARRTNKPVIENIDGFLFNFQTNEIVDHKLEYFTHLLKFMAGPLHYDALFKKPPFSINPMECTDLLSKANYEYAVIRKNGLKYEFASKGKKCRVMKIQKCNLFCYFIADQKELDKCFGSFDEFSDPATRSKRKSRQPDRILSAKKIKTKKTADEIIETTKEEDVSKMKGKIISISEDEEDETEVIMADFIKEKMFDLESESNDDFNTLPDFSKFLSESTDSDGVNHSSQNENEKTDNKEIEVVKDDILSSSSNLSDDLFRTTTSNTTMSDQFCFSLPTDEDIMAVPEFNFQMETFVKKKVHPKITYGLNLIDFQTQDFLHEAVTKNGNVFNKLVEKMIEIHNKNRFYQLSVDAIALVYEGVSRLVRDANIDVSKKQFASYVFLDPIFISCISELYSLVYADVSVCPKCLNMCNDSNICAGTVGILLIQACYILNFVKKFSARDIFKVLRKDSLDFANGDAANLANRLIQQSGLASNDYFKIRWKILGELEVEEKFFKSDAPWIKQIADLSISSNFSNASDYIRGKYTDDFLVEYSKSSIFYHLPLVKVTGMCFRCYGKHGLSACPYSQYNNIGLMLLFNYWASNTVMKAENLTVDKDSLFGLYVNVSLIKKNGFPLVFNQRN
jgi:hypothetical protein